MLSKGLPKEKIAMNGAMGFELVPNADYRVAPTPETIPLSSSKKILHKPLAGICNQKVFLPLWAISSSGQGLRSNFKLFRMQLRQLTPPMEVVCGNYQMFASMEMSCIVMKVCKTLMRGIC